MHTSPPEWKDPCLWLVSAGLGTELQRAAVLRGAQLRGEVAEAVPGAEDGALGRRRAGRLRGDPGGGAFCVGRSGFWIWNGAEEGIYSIGIYLYDSYDVVVVDSII